MKFSLPILAFALASFTPALALPEPAPAAPEPTVYSAPVVGRAVELLVPVLEKRNNAGVVQVDGLRYRTCPRTSCAAIGQYPKGTHITIVCYTRDDTTVVNGDAGWAKLTNGYWVALAFGEYVSWSGSIPYCT